MSDAPALARVTARFLDPGLEAEFRRESEAPESLRHQRFSVALASIAFVAYGIHDLLFLPDMYETAWKIRYGVFLPVVAVVLWALRHRNVGRFMDALGVFFGSAATSAVIWIGALAPERAYVVYTGYAALFVIMGPFLLRMSVAAEAAFTLVTLSVYLGLDVALVHADAVLVASVATTFLTMGLMGALVARQQTAQARKDFLQRRTIERQVVALDEEKRRSEELLLNVLPPAIAARLKNSSQPIADGFAEVSVLFADIVGFTGMSERVPPARMVERLNEVFSSFDDLAEKLRLEKIKTIGDAYMVAGGLNLERHDHAEAIAEMALAMQRRMPAFGVAFGEPLGLRVGIHTGPAVAGVIGKKKFIYDVWGDTVNTASRMESHGEPGTIHVTEAVHERLAPKYDFSARGEIEIKGKGRMRTYYLTGRKSSVARTHLPWEE